MEATVRDAMSTCLLLEERHLLIDALSALERRAVGGTVVDANGSFKGLLMRRDALHALHHGAGDSLTVGEICKRRVSVDPDESLQAALRIMDEKNVGYLPVVDGSTPVGGLTRNGAERLAEIERQRAEIERKRAEIERKRAEIEREWPELNTKISKSDKMYRTDLRDSMYRKYFFYLKAGLSGLRCIERGMAAVRMGAPTSILDLPCGHGRVLRFLKAAYPNAELVACDIDRDAVDFCEQTFDVRGVYSAEVPGAVKLGQQFDLIWCGSLLTHLDVDQWTAFLTLFASALAPDGVLVFTTHGTRNADLVREAPYWGEVVRRYKETGFGYTDYPESPGYGGSLSSLDWVGRFLDRETPFELVDVNEAGWNDTQDVLTVRVRSADRPV